MASLSHSQTYLMASFGALPILPILCLILLAFAILGTIGAIRSTL